MDNKKIDQYILKEKTASDSKSLTNFKSRKM